jgi:3-hydroxyisobutyrate dehydrogenase-like beta-hydroxyacid dehydrogenase
MAADGARGRVGFLGLGIMGSRMAANVARAGFVVTAWTHTPGKASAWAGAHGAAAVSTPAEAAAASDIVVSMVVDGEQVAEVMLGEEGVAAGARPGLLAIDSSTIGPAAARRVGAALAESGVEMLDAPVTGSSPRAEDGTLTIMVGGHSGGYERALPVLEAMGSLIVHVGGLGQGQMLKLLNNAVAAANAAALAEALVLARATGVDLDAVEKVLGAGSGGSVQLDTKAAAMRAHDFAPLFKAEHMLKDVRLCLGEARAAGVDFAAADHAEDLLSAVVARGDGEQDYAAIAAEAERRSAAPARGDAHEPGTG